MNSLEKLKQLVISVVSWIFVGFCLILAIGMPFCMGTFLMLLAAAMALPLEPVRKIWAAVLDMLPQEKKKLFESKKKHAEKKKTNKKMTKFGIIFMVFLFAFIFGMAATETPVPAEPSETAYATESPSETFEPTSEPTVIPTAAPTEPKETEASESLETTPLTETESVIVYIPNPDPTEPEIPIDSSFSIHFIDVGQADAALVECDDHYMLIDGGTKADSNVIYSVLKKASVPKLDIVVGTHAHEDHIGGLPGAFNYTTADLTLCPVTAYDSEAFKDFARYANQNGNGITVPDVGDTYVLGSATIKILGVNGGSDTNDTSIVLRIDYGQTSFLFTGDAEREAEQAILNTGADLSATVLKVGHHGSDTSTTYPFLREIMPQYAVISVGQDNSYGHPTEDTLSRLRDAEVTVFRTDTQGDVYCVSNGESVTMTVSRNADADVLSGPMQTTKPTEEPTEPPTEPVAAGTDYAVNTNTGKFHYIYCSSAKKIKSSNRWDFTGTRDELIGMGYVPCKNCNP